MLDSYDDPRITAYGMLVEAHAEASRSMAESMNDVGVPAQFLSVLIRLARSPGLEMRMTDLANEMTISTSGLTRVIDRMESDGLVERRSCPNDRRGLNAHVTDKGLALIENAASPHMAAIESCFACHLSDREIGQLTNLLRKVRDGIRTAHD